MPNPYGAPEVTVHDVAAKQKDDTEFLLVDVRELNELELASLPDGDFINMPLSELRQRRLDALPEDLRQDKDLDVVLFCHKGLRSAQVTVFLRQQGWSNAVSMAGGIDAWADEIDESVGKYASM
ncbi:MAG: rhodanese-like domain-containing protein [Caldilineaceae bacterium]|nr:rhodanese-like domain-containing protein [Caldilineaceae bacterium]MCY3993633.1 rhodanese-like domain-containing protein [Caldilineaceae bacterium]MDE0079896.1 rhodanese-like domain-containing protein [Caldilineaceae bacterium]MDE0312023.1 rhodanese-like domain-containing protein [Caldilineaceae bacterium]